MRFRDATLSLAAFAFFVASVASATVAYPPPRPLSEWLSDAVVFIGVGEASSVTIDPATGYASFTLKLLEAWKGTAPLTVPFSRWPFGYAGLSEGHRMVYYAFAAKFTHSKQLKYVSPEPIFRTGGRDCFRFSYASDAIPPENTYALRFTGKAKEQGLAPILLFSEFRSAVLAVKRPVA